MVEYLIFSVLNTLVLGMLLFMLSSGLTLIFSMMGVLNFAHASFYMLGAYFGYQITTVAGFWSALIISPLLVGILGAAVERYGLRTVHKYGHVAELLFTLGLFFIIEEGVNLIWGRNAMPNFIPASLDFPLFTLFNSEFSAFRAFMLLISVAIFIGLYLVLTRTRIGLIIQAALTHPEGVNALGHNVPAVFMMVFGGGSALAGLAGVIGGIFLITEPSMALTLGPIVFVVIVVGGMGSLTGAFVASLLLAGLQTFAVGLEYSLVDLLGIIGVTVNADGILRDIWRIQLSHIGPILPYLFMVLMLMFRPKGLLGKREN
ncbi:MAG: branched-chain amino acid ABC transporter permease [Proteobacteria bacterium]|nr:branched-chain amino acid ABC transporter permease [Pseudomonadota bacterium]MBU1386763.1 branched-chain amino acid ABC transporter permease [Pseudomonadota bacterium]MBU1544707.1 branched-chain amino acid ABC transporter permease [Pseudomonadota bacterium]MBU2430113.1 branched-chain amino acid ABC transporter permease [Pseudomonadota bacterium]MBU2481874.1 branched-chain amino acid ABC transporter permease [Pseudomonadota bacterium]